MTDLINQPPHYNSLGAKCDHCGKDIECRNINRHFKGNLSAAIKYIWRCDFKGSDIQDLKKAVNYLNDEITFREKNLKETVSWSAIPTENNPAITDLRKPCGHKAIDGYCEHD